MPSALGLVPYHVLSQRSFLTKTLIAMATIPEESHENLCGLLSCAFAEFISNKHLYYTGNI